MTIATLKDLYSSIEKTRVLASKAQLLEFSKSVGGRSYHDEINKILP